MYDADQLGLTNPEALQRTLWWHMAVLFGHRGHDESRQLKWGNVHLKTDFSGANYLEFNGRLTKIRNGGAVSGNRLSAPKLSKMLKAPTDVLCKRTVCCVPPSIPTC